MSDQRTVVDFWFDPRCPWAWITSRWMKEVEQVRPVRTRFRLMCLTYLNEDKDISPDYRARQVGGWGPVRVIQAAAEQFGDDVVDRLYTEMGTRFHDLGMDKGRETIEDALEATGLPRSLADTMEDDGFDDAIKKSHHEGMDRVGDDVGTPVISVGDNAFFGPVVTPIPRGDAAGRLWDGVVLVTSTEGFYELKRTRTVGPSFA